MKQLLSFMLAITFTLSASAQNDAIDRFFQSYQDDENFTMVFVSPRMFKMVAKVIEGQEDEEVEEIRELVKDIKGLKILSTEITPLDYYKEATNKIPTNDYELLMTVRDKGSNVKFLTKGNNEDVIEELLLIIGGDDNFTLMSFVGKIDLNKVGRLAKKLDIEGMEYLENLEK